MDNSDSGPDGTAIDNRRLDREIFSLALPTFATLVSEPLLLLVDTAVVGHLGTTQLAGLGVAANVLGILTGLCIFLAYGTTGTVARRLGAGDRAAALAAGLDGLTLAVGLGALLACALEAALPLVIQAYGVPGGVAQAANTYLRIAALTLPSFLLLLAGTGVLRGLQDTRTPLVVAVGTNAANIALNVTLVYGLGLGIAGSALGTLIAQTSAAVLVAVIVVRQARAQHARLVFSPGGVLANARSGAWLVVRTATLQVAITITTRVAATGGAVALAAHQIVSSLWTLLAFSLDAVAIAGQAIIGRLLGAGDATTGRAMTWRMVRWGVVCGALFGAAILLLRPLYVGLFTRDVAVQHLVARVLVVVAVATVAAGVVYVLDGVLIGAGDGRYLAGAGAVALLAFVPMVWAVAHWHGGLRWLWIAYGGFILARMATLLVRARGTAWARVGAEV